MQNKTDNNQGLEELITLYGDSIKSKIWRGIRHENQSKVLQNSIDTGYDSINKRLHSHGWPLGTITEFGLEENGIGELRLLIPALKKIQQSEQQKSIILIAPPHLPFAPAFNKEGIELDSLRIIKTKTLKDSLWAVEQCLIAHCCAAVICWTGSKKIDNHDLRRLQLASEKAQTWNVLFRHSQCLEQSSVSGLRIQLRNNSYSQLELNILKQRHGWGGQKCTISLSPHYENWQRLAVDLLPVHKLNYKQLEMHNRSTSYKESHLDVIHPKGWNSSVTILSRLSELQTVH